MASEQIRKHVRNRELILRSLHFDGPQKRVELSRRCAIRKSSVTNIVAELLADGLVRDVNPDNERSAIELSADEYSIAVARLSASAITFAMVGLDGVVRDVRKSALSASQTPQATADRIASRFIQEKKAHGSKLLGYGVAVPGIVNPAAGNVHYSISLGQWRDVELAELITAKLKETVRIDNNVRCQLWSSAWFDRLVAAHESILYVGIMQGVASSAILHGQSIRGGHFAAGEIGHIRAGDEGRLCNCGRTDCLEMYCGVEAISKEIALVRPKFKGSTAAEIAVAAGSDRAIVNILDRATERLSRALAGIIATLDPEVLVIGSGDRAFSELLQPLLQRHLYTELMGLDAREASIIIADSTEVTTLKGIAAMVIEDQFAAGADT